ncbi:MAG: hypothetical protein DRP58_07885 [Spirochaetes bacterium]|nr:MAG: hypothetical protein DRP58_07885 [Spirochaetota bacterium]
MQTDALIKKEGFEVLRNKLGEVNMERFIVLVNRDKFNYTEWRKNLFEDLKLEELAEKADQYSKGL